MGLKLDEVQLNDLGQVGEVVVTKDDCLLMKGRGEQSAIEQRVGQIKEEIDSTNSDYEREKFQERLAKLVGGVAVIKVTFERAYAFFTRDILISLALKI